MIIYEYNYWRISEARAQAQVGPGSATPLIITQFEIVLYVLPKIQFCIIINVISLVY